MENHESAGFLGPFVVNTDGREISFLELVAPNLGRYCLLACLLAFFFFFFLIEMYFTKFTILKHTI